MPVQRRQQRSPLECAQSADGPMESMARPDECKSQRPSSRSTKHARRRSDTRARKHSSRSRTRKTKGSFTSDSSVYSSPSPPSTGHRQSTASSTSSSIESNSSEDKDNARSTSPDAVPAVDTMNPDDRRLFEHWAAATEQSLTHSKGKDRSWQSMIRRESATYPALRHSTLALTAAQLALESEAGSAKRKSLLQDARRHYTHAVDEFPSLDDSSSDTPESTSDAAFSTASILFMCELTSPSLAEDGFSFSRSAEPSSQKPEEDQDQDQDQEKEHKGDHEEESPPSPAGHSRSLQELLDIFTTVRALSPSSKALDVVEKGKLEALFSQTDPHRHLPSTYTLTIFSMRNLNNATAKKDSSHETSVYDDAITKLDRSLEMLSKGGEPTMIALRWMFRVPPRYLELVREKKPLALIIFAHYSAVLHHLRDRWWMGDWGSRLVKEISQLLGSERMGSILWASDIVGIQT
ncbi:hypothetical protein ASPVEDRAFT_81228 [Aspergillus versicolor CBS 583.65]|uniref:Uncharacterized protein n=1 Tax=Aspergillus versicolor CBS 583.65 TaxID=1036611 RepID=A0A1L9PDN7_ASPVE|nr:uncharacterized protein ASPVEDRAFT_81228 [Aspergillus versicolor CBS 583.65]OJI99630.1 hypothetical protein ASPVEDRAFT_81228 [Aspergillus versicolor CBS 583.65]